MFARRAVMVGGGTALIGSVVALTLPRKQSPSPELPPPEFHEATAMPPASRLQGIAALRAIDPPEPIPPISFHDAAGVALGLDAFRGKVVVLNLWATWCAPCVAELPSLAILAGRVADRGILVIPLSLDRGGLPVVQRFLETHGIAGLGAWNDPEGASGRALGIRGLPTTYVLDRQGRRAAVLEGAADWGGDAAVSAVRRLGA